MKISKNVVKNHNNTAKWSIVAFFIAATINVANRLFQ